MEYVSRFQSVRARVATLDDDGEKLYLLFERGAICAVVAQNAFEALYVLKAQAPEPPLIMPAPEIPRVQRKYAKQRKQKALIESAKGATA